MLGKGSCLTALSIILQLREKALELRLQHQTQIDHKPWQARWAELSALQYFCFEARLGAR